MKKKYVKSIAEILENEEHKGNDSHVNKKSNTQKRIKSCENIVENFGMQEESETRAKNNTKMYGVLQGVR